MYEEKKAVVALSGGMDSTTVLAYLISKGYEVITYGFTYGSKHNQYENKAAELVAAHYQVPHKLINLEGVMEGFKSNLMKGQGDIPEGHYTDETMSATVVPSRNIIFASILSGLAWSEDAQIVGLGIHQGDHAIYPDCRTDFFVAMQKAILLGTDDRVRLWAPFLATDKIGILKWGLANDVPYKLTRTCYKDQPLSCGKCGSCQERMEGFEMNGAVDPIQYEGE